MFFQWFLICYIVADNDCIICLHLQYSTNCLSPHPGSNKCFQRRGFFVIETRKVCVNGRSLILVEMDRCYLKYFSVKFFVAFIQLYLTEIKQVHLLTNVNYCSCSSQSLYYYNNNFSRNISLSFIKMKGNFFFFAVKIIRNISVRVLISLTFPLFYLCTLFPFVTYMFPLLLDLGDR